MKKLISIFIGLFLLHSNNLSAQQQWLNINPVVGSANMSLANSIKFDRFNNPWILSPDISYNYMQLFTQNGGVWSIADTLALATPGSKIAIDNNDDIYYGISSSIGKYNFNTGSNVIFQLSTTIGNYYTNVLVNPINQDKWFYSPIDFEWVKLNNTDTIHYSLDSLGIPNNAYNLEKGCFNSNGDFLFSYSDTSFVTEILTFDGNQWSHTNSLNSSLPSYFFAQGITCDKFNNIWLCGTSNNFFDNSLLKFDGINTTVFLDSSSGAGYYFTDVVTDDIGNAWCYNNPIGLWKCDGQAFTSFISPYSISESFLSIDKNNSIWFSTDYVNGPPGVVVFNESGFKTLSGNVYNDINANGMRDVGELGLPNEVVASSTLSNFSTTTLNGDYNIIFFDSSQVCQIDHQLKPYRTHTTTPTTYNITPAINGTNGFDFGVYATPGINDMSIYTSPAIARPGFDCSYNINWNNTGTTTQSDTITFTYDPALTYLNATPTPLSVSGNTLKWKFTNAQPLDNGNITVHFNVPVTIAIGDTLNCLAAIGNVSIDNTPADNAWASQTIVTGSFDPNEKIAEPSQFAVAGEWLYYTIYFQNTGTDTAFTVIVRDTLDTNLDIASFEMLGSSHTCYTELSGFGFLKFTFNNILLPDSNVNETMSHGYVTYRVRAAANVAIGTPINNTAYIYFDFNSPVVTNTTLNTVHNPLAVKEVLVKNDFALIPNPASTYITINAKGIKLPYTVEITDATGRVLNKVNVTAKQQRINTSKLVNGVYFVTVKNEQAGITKKLVVQK